MGDEIKETDIAGIDKLLAETKEHVLAIRNKAYELNIRTAQPAKPEKAEKPQGDVGTEIREKLIRINEMLSDAFVSLEAFV